MHIQPTNTYSDDQEVLPNATNIFLTGFLVIGLFFGVVFYDFIDKHLGFSYVDEILSLILCSFTLFRLIHDKTCKLSSYWYYLFGIFGFYILYSFSIHSNTNSAILQDAIVEIKPFLGFFCMLSIGERFTQSQKKILIYSCYIAITILLFVTPRMVYFMGHTSRYASAITYTALFCCYLKNFNIKTLVIFILMLSMAALSGRSKAFGFIILATFLSIFFYKDLKAKCSFQNLLVFMSVLFLTILVAWEKIYFYFIYGAENIMSTEANEAFARPAMYWGAWQILHDNPLLGSGFASFATYFSAESYSNVYYEYNLNLIQGLSEKMPDFITDAYYPSLAQYGFIGIGLFIFFWSSVIKRATKYKLKNNLEASKLYFIIITIVVFFAIELIADTTLTHNRGLFMMILLGLSCRKLELLSNTYEKENNFINFRN